MGQWLVKLKIGAENKVSLCFINRREGRCRNNSRERLRLTSTWGWPPRPGGHHKMRAWIGWTDPCCITDWLEWVRCFLWFFCYSFFPVCGYTQSIMLMAWRHVCVCVWSLLDEVPAGFVSCTISWALNSAFGTLSLQIQCEYIVCVCTCSCVSKLQCPCHYNLLSYTKVAGDTVWTSVGWQGGNLHMNIWHCRNENKLLNVCSSRRKVFLCVLAW